MKNNFYQQFILLTKPLFSFIIKLTVILSILLIIILYYKLNLNPNYDFITIIKDTLIPVIQAEQLDVEYIKVHAEDLRCIKNYYCGDELRTYLCKAVNSQIHSNQILLTNPSRESLPWQHCGLYKMRASFNLSDYSFSYRDSENWEIIKPLISGWPRSGWMIPIKKDYAHEVIEIISKK